MGERVVVVGGGWRVMVVGGGWRVEGDGYECSVMVVGGG